MTSVSHFPAFGFRLSFIFFPFAWCKCVCVCVDIKATPKRIFTFLTRLRQPVTRQHFPPPPTRALIFRPSTQNAAEIGIHTKDSALLSVDHGRLGYQKNKK